MVVLSQLYWRIVRERSVDQPLPFFPLWWGGELDFGRFKMGIEGDIELLIRVVEAVGDKAALLSKVRFFLGDAHARSHLCRLKK